MVSHAAGGAGAGAYRAAPQPGQPARHQTQDVEVAQKTPRTSSWTALEENLCGNSGYNLTNGIVLKHAGTWHGRPARGSESRPRRPCHGMISWRKVVSLGR